MNEQKKLSEKEILELKNKTLIEEVFRKPVKCYAEVTGEDEVTITRDRKVLEKVPKEKFKELYIYQDDYRRKQSSDNYEFLKNFIHEMGNKLKEASSDKISTRLIITGPTQQGVMKVFIHLRESGKDDQLIYSDGVTIRRPKLDSDKEEGERYLISRIIFQMWQVFTQALLNYKMQQELAKGVAKNKKVNELENPEEVLKVVKKKTTKRK